jgi:putative transposase
LYKTELIEHDRRRSSAGRADVEQETASWVHWFNATRLHHSIGKRSPIEFEEHYRHTSSPSIGEVA